MAEVASAIVVVRASSRVASPGGRPAPATDVKYTGKMAVMIVVANAEFARSYIAQAPKLGAMQAELRQNVFRAIHSRIRESMTT